VGRLWDARSPSERNFPQTQVDPERMHLARLARLRAELRRIGGAGGLFYDPTNIRYATGTYVKHSGLCAS